MPSTPSPKRKGHYVICKAKNKEIYWQFWKNGREIARSSETYKRKAGVKKSIAALQGSATCEIVDETIKRRGFPYGHE